MNPDRLLALYERIADTPDAVVRLRRFILDLAVRGRLVAQDPEDEPAGELLKRIALEKARLIKAGEIKPEKPLTPIQFGDLPFHLPGAWLGVRLADISVCLDYRRKPINATEREKRIEGKSPRELFPYFGATQQQGWIDGFLFDEELVLLGEDGVPFFDPLRPKAYLISGKSWVNNHAHVFKGILISHAFLVHCLNVFDYSGRVVGATRSKLNQARAINIPVPLPPLAEQHRIVAKVDELMALCDRLETARAQRESTRDRLAAASLARLNAPDPDPATFTDHARFVLDALSALTTRPDQIKQLRQTILNLAVRGRLVAQDPADEPHAELLAKIPTKPLHQGHAPMNWRSATVGTLLDFKYGKGLKASERTETGPVPVYGSNGVVGYTDDSLTDRPSIIVGRKGSAGALNLCDGPSWTTDVAYFVESPAFFNLQFLLYTLSALDLDKLGKGVKPGLSRPDAYELLICIPPLAEQHRIVAKVDELMALCDRLEASLATADSTRRRLLDALLREALAPTTTADSIETAEALALA